MRDRTGEGRATGKPILALILGALALVLGGCGGSKGEPITIGSANFSENVLLAYVYADALEKGGYKTIVEPNVGSREALFPALEEGRIDMAPEYAGSLLNYLDPTSTAHETNAVLKELRAALPPGLTILKASTAQNKDVNVVTSQFAKEHGLKTVADLADVDVPLVFGAPPESEARRAGLLGLTDVYGLDIKGFETLDGGGPLTVAALKRGNVQVAQMYSTQPAIVENQLVILEDPLNMSTAENVVPLVREDILTPELEAVINKVTASLSTDILVRLNTMVEVDKRDPQKVAKEYVESLRF